MNGKDVHRLTGNELVVWASPHGGALRGASFAGIDVLIPAGGPKADMASFPLVPFGNRLEFNEFQLKKKTYRFQPNSSDQFYLHGDGWLRDWCIDDVNETTIAYGLRQRPNDTTPYDYTARQHISVTGDTLRLELAVTNEAEHAMLFGLGHHPFFVRTARLHITASARDYWTERVGHLPGDKGRPPADLNLESGSSLPLRFINNAFGGWNGRALIDWPELGIAAEIDTDPSHKVLMLYAPTDRTDIFCLEPMTHMPNAHHMADGGGLMLLQNGATMRSCMTIHFRRHKHG